MFKHAPLKTTIKSISKYLHKHGLPVYWQYLILLTFILSVSIPFINDNLSFHIVSISALLITLFGFIYQAVRSDRPLLLWGPLFIGVILIKISLLIQETTTFQTEINKLIPFWIEQAGIIFICIFAFKIMFLLEKKLHLTGLTSDFSLFILSLSILFLLTNPKLLDNFLHHLDLHQQLLISKLLFGFVMLTMIIFLQFITKKIVLHNVLLTFTILFIITHFSIDLFNSFNILSINPKISKSIYHLAGVSILVFAFIENISLHYYHEKNSYALSSGLMWVSSITAACTIPLSILVRWYQNQEPIDIYLIGIFSFILSSIVIWRLILLIKNSQQQGRSLKKIAFTDSLTSLLNYHGLIEKLDSHSLENTIVIAINIDDFRSINDLYGRNFGDEVLTSLAERLLILPSLITASRMSSALFFVAFHIKSSDVHKLMKDIQKSLGIWDMVSGHRIAVPLTYGASHSKISIDPKLLIRQAEDALTSAKTQHNRYAIYHKSTNDQLPRHKIREILQQAIDRDYLPVHFQPIYNIENGTLTAMELLIRIRSKDNGMLMPGQFLEQAQAYGLLTPLTKICINMVAKNFDKLPNVTININLPSYMLDNPILLSDFLDYFKEKKLPTNRFCLEIMEDQDIPAEQLIKSVQQLKKLGFTIAMDDFGTGYSSLSRLSMLPFDTIKVDRSLLLAASTGNKAILESAIKLIKRLNLSVVVEGVETIEQLALIKLLGADSVQGFLLSKPVDISKAKRFPLNADKIIAEF